MLQANEARIGYKISSFVAHPCRPVCDFQMSLGKKKKLTTTTGAATTTAGRTTATTRSEGHYWML